MLQRLTEPRLREALSIRTRRLLWTVTMLDVMAVSWMLAAGDWFDQHSRLSSVATLGGHHLVVLWLALVGFVLLATLATLTDGFVVASRLQLGMLSIAAVLSLVALSGMLSVLAFVVAAVFAAAILGRAIIR